MIKKIFCPIDFSEVAMNAAEYAAKLASIFEAELLFVNVQRITPVAAEVSMGEGIGSEVRRKSEEAVVRLKDLSNGANKMFNISTDYEVDITTKSFEQTFSSIESENSMIVMGTNGVDDLTQFFFGTHTYHIIKKTKCPLLLVPKGVSYEGIKKIVFAWDYTSSNKFSLSLLYDFMKAFNPQFIFVHVSKHSNEISKEVFRALKSEIESVLGKENNAEFEQLFSAFIPESIDEYMVKSNADLLSITFYDRGILRNIFHGNVAKTLCEVPEYPILVLHA